MKELKKRAISLVIASIALSTLALAYTLSEQYLVSTITLALLLLLLTLLLLR